MRSQDCMLAVLAVVGIAAGCGGKPYDPWLAPESEFRSTVSRIALITVQTPEGLEDPDPVLALFDSLLTSTLGAAGFDVIPSARASALWSHAMDSVGGAFDPNTGRADTMKVWAIQRHVLGRLEADDSADALLADAIVIVRADFREHKARWDGASQTIGESEAPVPRTELFVDPARNSRAVWLALQPIIEPVRQVAAMDDE